MKRHILTILIMMTTLSCTKYIEFSPEQKESTLVVNALMKADEDEHDIFVGLSTVDMMTPVKSGDSEVSFCIGDGPAVKARHIGDNNISSAFKVKAAFKPGDKVRLTVRSQGLAAEAETIVPVTASIDKVDTLTIMVKDSEDSWEAVRFTVNVVDHKDSEDKYMLMAKMRVYVTDEAGNTISGPKETKLELDNKLEPLLNGGVTAGADVMDYAKYSNPDNIFSDNDFKDGSHGLKVLAKKYDLTNWSEVIDYSIDGTVYVHSDIVFYIYTISSKEFNYRRSANILYANDYDMTFMEPVSLPSNIVGGIGIFGIGAADTFSMKMPVETLHINGGLWTDNTP